MYACFWRIVNIISRGEWCCFYERICFCSIIVCNITCLEMVKSQKTQNGWNRRFNRSSIITAIKWDRFFKPEIVLSFLPFVTGALLILDGIVKVPLIKEMWDWGNELRWSGILSAALPLLLGIFLAAYPFHAAAVVIRVFGIFLLVDGVSDIVRSSMIKRKADF